VIDKRPSRGSYIGFGKRLPSTEPPVLTPRELALLAPEDLAALSRAGRNGGALGNGRAAGTGSGTTPPAAPPPAAPPPVAIRAAVRTRRDGLVGRGRLAGAG